MTDPERLIEADDVGADLLASARSDGPSRRARARAAAVLGVGVGIAAATAGGTASASAGAGAGAGAAAKIGSVGLLTKIIGGTVLVAAIGGGTAVAVRESSRPPPAPVVTVAAPVTAATTSTASPPKAPVVAEEPTPAPAPVPVPTVELTALPSAPIAASKPLSRPATAPSAESPLTRELHSLDAAKARLEARDASGAIAALDRHDREFPHGALRAESAMLRVEALLVRGDDAGAKARAKDLLARDPNGPHAKRLRTILDR